MLLSVKKAYDRNMFNDENPCSVDLETIEVYLQIFQPTYILSQQFQLNHSSIADIIPSIKQLIHTYLQMDGFLLFTIFYYRFHSQEGLKPKVLSSCKIFI
jgi:hypothetical protein